MKHGYFYHWTHNTNLGMILREGLRPDLATGSKKSVWFVDSDYQEWALIHVAARHGWNVKDLVCLKLEIPENLYCKSSRDGVYFSNARIAPGLFQRLLTGPGDASFFFLTADWS